MTQAIRLADDVRMERDAHDERLALRLREHLVEVVDDHVGEVAGVHLPRDDHRDVVQLLRIGDGPELAILRFEFDRLVVVGPVEGVLVARLGEEVGRVEAL